MKIIPVKTNFFPVKGDLFKFLERNVRVLKEKSIVFISSKIISLWQGRCVPLPQIKAEQEKLKINLAKIEAERVFCRLKNNKNYLITQNQSALIINAGIDPAYGKYFILHPKEPYQTAKTIQNFLKEKFKRKKVAVVIVDSKTQPFRRGKMGYSLGFFGLSPYLNGTDKSSFPYNLVDSLASMADCFMSLPKKMTPLVIFESVGYFVFFDESEDWRDDFFVGKKRDMFRNLEFKV